MTKNRKDAEAPNQNHIHHIPGEFGSQVPARIYKAPKLDEDGVAHPDNSILAAVQSPTGRCFIGIHGSRLFFDEYRPKGMAKLIERRCHTWEEAQQALDKYAEDMGLTEIDIFI